MNIKDKKILVTGADGFIGSHLVETLINKGCDVRAFVYYNSFNSLGWLDTLPSEKLKNLDIFSGDIRDPNGVDQAVKGCDVLFHLAALIAIPYSYQSPDSYVETNIRGTLNVLQAARTHGVQKVVTISTSEVYGTAQYVPIDEKHSLQAQSPYSATKIGADAISTSFYNAFNLPVVIARPFNTYGPRQSARAVIPTIISQIASGASEIQIGDTTPTRDLNYVLDTCKGMIELAECDSAIGQVVNIGSHYEISVGEVLEKIKKIMNSNAVATVDQQRIRPPKSEVQRLWCDNSKIRSLTGFKPDHSLDDGLKLTVEWFMQPENSRKYKPEVYNV
ncbi:MAG: SDR family oxidoreductase [Candidatus Omnitrophica bacterium]|nr:SDR family oxidoreductase [Candidatus Omnitrophota bacterium]